MRIAAACADRALAGERGEQLVLAVAGESGDAEDLPAAHRERDALQVRAKRLLGGQAQRVDRQPRFAQRTLCLAGHTGELVADHQLGHGARSLPLRVTFGDHPTLAQDGRALAQRLDLLKLVADVQDRATLGGELTQGREQPLHLLRGQHRGRLVHDQELRVLQQAAHDFDALALADGERVHVAARVERQAVSLGHLDDPGSERAQVTRIIHAERDVLEHGHRLEQREMLEHHADAEAARLLRAGDRDLAAVPADRARIGLEHAVDDLDQRALAGAVLAEQGMDLARQHRKPDVVVGEHAAGVAFANAAQLEPRGRRCLVIHALVVGPGCTPPARQARRLAP